jgi:hypothetical protein
MWEPSRGDLGAGLLVHLKKEVIFFEVLLILVMENKGRFRLWPNFERRSVWTNENAKMPKVRPLGLHTRGRSPKDVAFQRA